MDQSRRTRRATSPRGLKPGTMERVRIYVDTNIGEALTLTSLANAACMSNSQFARMFRVTTGDSPMNFVSRRRIEHARLRLEGGGLPLSQLAAELGFCDHSHFTRMFRQVIGITPSDYLRNLGEAVHGADALIARSASAFLRDTPPT
ncbi:helix-turn-helix transcriptional regulator [Undibacterium sp. TJN25]|uniref:helix-turn-helix transcriptional regulator n=1 Tax=Undibacterium sp. TJN25 TaxID=3413056 RepID=UPI003BF3D159